MKKCLLIPTLIFPYIVCLCLGYGFVAQSFSNVTIKVVGILALATLVLSFICNLIYIFASKKEYATDLLKTAFLIKVIHIPTYILIFVLGVIMGLMVFMTLPLIILLIVIDLLTLWISGMISIHALIKSLKEGEMCPKALFVIALVCQMFFCADIISMLVIRIVIRKNKLMIS